VSEVKEKMVDLVWWKQLRNILFPITNPSDDSRIGVDQMLAGAKGPHRHFKMGCV